MESFFMQILSPLRIKVETREEMILQILLDKHCREILTMTKKDPKAVKDICRECKIPLSTGYRRLSILKDLKFLDITYTIRPDGKKSALYKNRVKELHVYLDDDELCVINTQS